MFLLHLLSIIGLFVFTVNSESIQTLSLFPHFVTLQPYSKIDQIYIFPHQSTHNSPQ